MIIGMEWLLFKEVFDLEKSCFRENINRNQLFTVLSNVSGMKQVKRCPSFKRKKEQKDLVLNQINFCCGIFSHWVCSCTPGQVKSTRKWKSCEGEILSDF